MNDPISFGMIALEHIRYLVNTIGPRPAGSNAEKRAIDYATEQLIRFGYKPEVKQACFAPPPAFYFENILAGVIIILAGWSWRVLPWFSLAAPFLLLLLPEIEKWMERQRPRTGLSHTVYAESDYKEDTPLLIFCAHCDSAMAMAIDYPFLTALFAQGMRILQRIAILIALLSIVVLMGFELSLTLYRIVGLAATLIGGWFALTDLINQLEHHKGYTPGALDNASGVGMVLALAEYYAIQNPPQRVRLGFLVTGAEETGLHGAAAFAEGLAKKEKKVAVFNLDMVGAGHAVQVVTREGSLFSQGTTRSLNQLLFEVHPQAKGVWYSLKSGDFAAFLRKGIDAVSIQLAGSSEAEAAYHTRRDGMDMIDISSLELCGNLVNHFVEMLPYSRWGMEK
jgi:aminopeptidase YwaD